MDIANLAILVALLILASTITAALVGVVIHNVPVALALGVGTGALVANGVVALSIRGRYERIAPSDREEDVTE
jgi:uncharacterized transporter YbjL